MNDIRNISYQSLALLCRRQAALASTVATRAELEQMAREYQELAERQARRWPRDTEE